MALIVKRISPSISHIHILGLAETISHANGLVQDFMDSNPGHDIPIDDERFFLATDTIYPEEFAYVEDLNECKEDTFGGFVMIRAQFIRREYM